MTVDAVILAGAPAEEGMQPIEGYTSRAMVQIADKTMLQWVVDGLRASGCIGKIIVVGDVVANGVDTVIAPGDGFLENMMKGINACEDSAALVLSSDIPLITGESIAAFVSEATQTGADMCYPIISAEACKGKYPDMKRTYLKTAEGTFTGGNIMLLNTEFIRRNENKIADAYAARKTPVKLAAMIGFGALVRVIMAQVALPALLPIPMLEKAVSRMLGGKVAAIRSKYAEIGEDVDKPSDLDAVRKILVG